MEIFGNNWKTKKGTWKKLKKLLNFINIYITMLSIKEIKRELSYKIKFNNELIEKLEKEIVRSLEELSVYE